MKQYGMQIMDTYLYFSAHLNVKLLYFTYYRIDNRVVIRIIIIISCSSSSTATMKAAWVAQEAVWTTGAGRFS